MVYERNNDWLAPVKDEGDHLFLRTLVKLLIKLIRHFPHQKKKTKKQKNKKTKKTKT